FTGIESGHSALVCGHRYLRCPQRPSLFQVLPPPRPTLFPYTTLFRSSRIARSDRRPSSRDRFHPPSAGRSLRARSRRRARSDRPDRKSTRSELQSQSNLVCRLLLEKKKKTPIQHKYMTNL